MVTNKHKRTLIFILLLIIGSICIVAFLEDTHKRIGAGMMLSGVLLCIQSMLESYVHKKHERSS